MTLDNERFFIEYSDGLNRWDPFVLYFNIHNSNISKFWKSCLKNNYIGNNNNTNCAPLDKRYMQRGFVGPEDTEFSRNLQTECIEMNHAISIINEGMVPLGYPFINLNFSYENLINDEIYRNLMNEIHHHFEILIGQVWDISEWYKKADEKTRWGIHQINNHCHAIESIVEHRLNSVAETLGVTGINYNAVNKWNNGYHPEKKYYEFEDIHYLDFKKNNVKWGDIIPYYSQLGKSPREAFEDQDDHIDKKNISAHRYMTGECNICFFGPGNNNPFPTDGKELEFKNWLEANGWSYDDPELCIGNAVIGEVDFSLYPNISSYLMLDRLIKRCDNITEIGFVDENLNKVISQRYEYTWQDQYKGELNIYNLDSPYDNLP